MYKRQTYTNAVHGFFSMLIKALGDYRPDGLCVMMDMHAPTFRHTLYDGYKAKMCIRDRVTMWPSG